jgi:hypothetical protein
MALSDGDGDGLVFYASASNHNHKYSQLGLLPLSIHENIKPFDCRGPHLGSVINPWEQNLPQNPSSFGSYGEDNSCICFNLFENIKNKTWIYFLSLQIPILSQIWTSTHHVSGIYKLDNIGVAT